MPPFLLSRTTPLALLIDSSTRSSMLAVAHLFYLMAGEGGPLRRGSGIVDVVNAQFTSSSRIELGYEAMCSLKGGRVPPAILRVWGGDLVIPLVCVFIGRAVSQTLRPSLLVARAPLPSRPLAAFFQPLSTTVRPSRRSTSPS
jgi:hypothetical protein